MAKPGRPASESSYCSEAGMVTLVDEDEHAPIFSLSKSSMDVVMATGPPHKRDPAWTRLDLRRSSSTNTHSEQNSGTLQQLHPHMWQHVNIANSHQLSLAALNAGERRVANAQRWSECSGSTHSRSSTPDTVVWKGGSSRPPSLTQDACFSAGPDSPLSRLASPPNTPSPFISPLHTPTSPNVDLLTSGSSLTLSPRQQEDLLTSTSTTSPLSPPLQDQTSSPLPSNSPDLLQLSATDDESFLENNLLSFQFPSPIPASVSLTDVPSDVGCLLDNVIEVLQGPGGSQLSDGGERSPEQRFSDQSPHPPAEGQDSGRGAASVCRLELPWQLGPSCATGRGWRSPLVSSLSDSRLGDCCKCNLNSSEGVTKPVKVEVFREEGTMTSQLELVDAEVQTVSPVGSWWNLRRNISTSNMGSHSILGSPPGSRLNLKSSVGSNSNLVSPSSSMFPASSGEEEEARRGDDPTWDLNSASSHDLERRRSCLKIQGEERDELGRRSSMKQVQWDEDGMTWDIHGASVDPEELSTAIQKHLELQNSPRPLRHSSKKKKAPQPPLLSNVAKATAPELNPPAMIVTSTCTGEGESEQKEYGGREVEEVGDKKEETAEAARRTSRAEGGDAKEEEEEVHGEEGTSQPKSPSHGSAHGHKKSVIRSLRRPGWCGGSRKADD